MAVRIAVVIVAIVAGAAVARAQSAATDFELQVSSSPEGLVSVRCTRGCGLVVLVHHPVEDVTRWDVIPDFRFQCRAGNCSSGKVLGGVTRETGDTFVAAPAFDLLIENQIVSTVRATVVTCVRGCSFAAAVRAPRPGDPEPGRATVVRFPCDDQGCASGRISGRIEPQD